MLLEDHRRRVARLLRRERKVADLHSLFSDLRLMRPGRPGPREIGHFAAHRHERDSDISLARADDIQTSARLWHLQLDDIRPTAKQLTEAGRANLRMMPERQIKDGFGMSRQTAEQSFAKAIGKFESGRLLKKRERRVLEVFGLGMMWQIAFSDESLWSDFVELLVEEGALSEEDVARFEPVSTFVILYALSIMHGARLKLADGMIAQLRLAASEEGGFLRIKAEIPIRGVPHPVTTSVPMFDTGLSARDHCDPELIAMSHEPVPAEIEGDRLVVLA